MSTEYGASVEQVLGAFGEQDYWLARLADSGADDATLESMQSAADGIDVITLQVLRRDRLPGVVTQFHRGDLCVRREERWGPVTDGQATATILGSILEAPATLSGTAVLEPLPQSGGARLRVRASVEVRIPLVGGKLENFIGNQLVELLIAEQRFTTMWISQNA